MERKLVFYTIMIDSVPISQNHTYSFFQDSEENGPSITELSEQQALRWLLNIPAFKEKFISQFFPDPKEIKLFFDQVSPFTTANSLPGDLDLIMVNPQTPDQPVAFECKKIKVVSKGTETPKINNLKALHRGVEQINAYQSLGFCRSYLMVLLLDDGRTLTTPNTMFRYSKDASLEAIYNIPFTAPLHPDVGVIYVRINQMTGKHYNYSISLGFCIDKNATYLEQTYEMTNKIRSLLSVI